MAKHIKKNSKKKGTKTARKKLIENAVTAERRAKKKLKAAITSVAKTIGIPNKVPRKATTQREGFREITKASLNELERRQDKAIKRRIKAQKKN